MKFLFGLAVVCCVLSTLAPGGEIYGTVSDESTKPLPNAIIIARSSDGKTEVARDTTDAKGGYRFFVKKTGTTRIIVLRDKTELAGEAVSYPNPVRYNWILEKVNDKVTLRRQQ